MLAKGYPQTPGMSPETPDQMDFQLWMGYPDTLDFRVWRIWALYPENLGKARENNHVLLFEWYLCLTKVCLGSLEH